MLHLNTSNVINKLNFQRKMEKEKEYLNTSNVINKLKGGVPVSVVSKI